MVDGSIGMCSGSNGLLFFTQTESPIDNSIFVARKNDTLIPVRALFWAYATGNVPAAASAFPGAFIDLVALPSPLTTNPNFRLRLVNVTSATAGLAFVTFRLLNLTQMGVPQGLYELRCYFNVTMGMVQQHLALGVGLVVRCVLCAVCCVLCCCVLTPSQTLELNGTERNR